MRGRRKRLIAAICLLVVAAALIFWSKYSSKPEIKETMMADGLRMQLIEPAAGHNGNGIIIGTEKSRLTPEQLVDLSERSGRRLVQFTLRAHSDSQENWRQFAEAERLLGEKPLAVAGMDEAAAFAYRWLAAQTDDKAMALSVQFSVETPDASEPLPPQVPHGMWRVVWNNDPDDATGVFIRSMPQDRIAATIGRYEATAPELLLETLPGLSADAEKNLPLVELPALPGTAQNEQNGTVVIFYSGDGGWRDLDKVSGEYMAAHGYSVVGVDCLKLFWQHKTPEKSASDLAWIMRQYRAKWGAKRFVLAGYSFGADMMPALYNKLSSQDRNSVAALVLLAFSRQADFEIAVTGWLGGEASETQTIPELQKIPQDKIVCVYGTEEKDGSACLQVQPPGERIELPGGHHFDEDYEKLARLMMAAIERRMANSQPETNK